MRISEIFYSVQGEGELTGMPTVFIRTSGCNLRCAWCDTPYASWRPEGTEMSISEILAEVNKHESRFVVLTGGEPMIAKGIRDLAKSLHHEGKHITIETAGTVSPGGIKCDLASISPKFGNSKPQPETIDPAWIKRHEETRWQPEVLREWMANYHHQVKLVVQSEWDVHEALTAFEDSDLTVKESRIFLMPEGITAEAIAQRRSWLIDFCKDHGYRYCNRLHIELFGNTRGT
jgi:7-carboxy-7-deazaguanine synthase